jgi:hypothetical protein
VTFVTLSAKYRKGWATISLLPPYYGNNPDNVGLGFFDTPLIEAAKKYSSPFVKLPACASPAPHAGRCTALFACTCGAGTGVLRTPAARQCDTCPEPQVLGTAGKGATSRRNSFLPAEK